jgi:hypothetical protein
MATRRERIIMIVAGAALGLLVVDQYVLSPVLASRERLTVQKQALTRELAEANRLRQASVRANQRWKAFRAAGLKQDVAGGESGFLNAMRAWSAQKQLPLTSIRPDRSNTPQGLNDLTFQVSADGSMRAIAGFLHSAQTASMPVRIHELQLATRSAGSDELSMQVRISTLWEDRLTTGGVNRDAPAGAPASKSGPTPATRPDETQSTTTKPRQMTLGETR